MIKFRCPGCQQGYTISPDKAGNKIKCQKCGTKMRIPAPSAKSDGSKKSGSSKSKKSETPVSPKLEKALDSLFDDDDEMFQDEGTGQTIGMEDEVGSVRLEAADDDESGVDIGEVRLEPDDEDGATVRLEPDADADDDVASVLEFEDSLDKSSSASSAAPPLPDELFSDEEDEEDDDEDDEDGGISRAGDDEEMDLTPMVDVTFLLLIFFMITASFSIQKTMQMPPPQPDEEGASMQPVDIEEEKDDNVIVEIDQRNLITIDDDPLLDMDQLVTYLRNAGKPEILIKAHEECLHEVVVQVMDAAQEVEMQRIRLAITKN